MIGDLAAILDAAAATPSSATSAPAPTPADADALARMGWGEARGEPDEGVAAAMWTALNRAKATGQPIAAVVSAPNQYQGYNADALKVGQDDPDLQRTSKIAQDVLAGKIADPTNGATHFANLDTLKANGTPAPQWATGTGQKIGAHTFFKGDAPGSSGVAGDELAAILDASAPDSAAKADADVYNPKTGEAWNSAQTQTARALQATGAIAYDPKADNAAPTYKGKPLLASADGTAPDVPGAYWIDPKGALHQVAEITDTEHYGAPEAYANAGLLGLGNKLMAGVQALKATGGNLLNPELGNYYGQALDTYNGAQGRYAAQHPVANGIATTAGNLQALVPTLALGGEVLGPIAEAAGPAGRFLAGNAGDASSLTNRLLQFASKGSNEAVQGAAAGALTSNESDQPIGQQVLTGAALGPLLGRGGSAVGTGLQTAGNAARAMIEPFSEGGQGNIANRLISQFADGGPTTVNAAEIVPGSQPTLAQATANPGLATLERAVRDVRPNQFIEKAQQNADARSAAVDALKGDPQSLADLIEARSKVADPVREAAFQNAQPTDPAPVVKTIDDILGGPSGQRDAVKSALGNIRSKLVQPVDMGGATPVLQPQTDPAQLYGIRQAITDMLSPMAGKDQSDARLAARELGQVKDALDTTIEQGAPGYRDYLKAFSDASKPVDTQSYLQNLNLTDSQGNLTLAKVDSALKGIERQRAKSGVNEAKSIPDDVLQQLYGVRADLQRQANSSLGKSIGSNTFQNLATNNLMGQLGAPAALLEVAGHHPAIGMALGAGKLLYGSKNADVLDALTNRLLDPNLGSAALNQVPSGSLLSNPAWSVAGRLAPAAAVSANRLFAQPNAQ